MADALWSGLGFNGRLVLINSGDERNRNRTKQQGTRSSFGFAQPLFNVVANDERTPSSSNSVELSTKNKNSSVEGVQRALSDDSRRVRDNGPSGVRRPEEAQRNLKQAVGVGNKIVVSFPYDKELVNDVKNLIGRRYEPENKRWICDPSADLEQFLAKHLFGVDDFAKQMLVGSAKMNSVTQDNAVLILKVGYNQQLLEDIRSIPTRKWDKASKHWTFSIVAIQQLAKLAQDYGLTWDVADENVDKPQVVLEDGWLSVAFSADRDVQEIISDLYGTRFDGRQMRWLVPMDYAPEIKLATDKHGFRVSAEIEQEFKRVEQQVELLLLSKSQNAVLDIPGLCIQLMPFQKAGVLYALKAFGAEQQENGTWFQRTLSPQVRCD